MEQADRPDSVTDEDVIAILNIVDTLLVNRNNTYTPMHQAKGKLTKYDDDFTGPSDLVVHVDFPRDEVLGGHRANNSDEIETCEFRRFHSYVNHEEHDKNTTHVFRVKSYVTQKTYSIWISLGVEAVRETRRTTRLH